MHLNIHSPWLLFCLAFGLMLLGTYLMGLQSRRLITMDPVRREVSMLAFEFPSGPGEIANIIRGIYLLPEDEKKASIRSFRLQLILDFLLFMPGAYGGIFILCMRVADKMSTVGHALFISLAWAQCLCLLLDVLENIYFWSLIRPTVRPLSTASFRLFQLLELLKWGLALMGAVCGFSAVAYFWLSGQYQADATLFVGIFFLELIIFLKFSGRKPDPAAA